MGELIERTSEIEEAVSRLAVDESVPPDERVRRIAEMLATSHASAARIVAASMGELGTKVTDNADGTVTIRTFD